MSPGGQEDTNSVFSDWKDITNTRLSRSKNQEVAPGLVSTRVSVGLQVVTTWTLDVFTDLWSTCWNERSCNQTGKTTWLGICVTINSLVVWHQICFVLLLLSFIESWQLTYSSRLTLFLMQSVWMDLNIINEEQKQQQTQTFLSQVLHHHDRCFQMPIFCSVKGMVKVKFAVAEWSCGVFGQVTRCCSGNRGRSSQEKTPWWMLALKRFVSCRLWADVFLCVASFCAQHHELRDRVQCVTVNLQESWELSRLCWRTDV